MILAEQIANSRRKGLEDRGELVYKLKVSSEVPVAVRVHKFEVKGVTGFC